MRVHTTAVPATKYLPARVHCKLTDDFNVPNNTIDKTYSAQYDHHTCAVEFVKEKNLGIDVELYGFTLTNRGYVYKVVEG